MPSYGPHERQPHARDAEVKDDGDVWGSAPWFPKGDTVEKNCYVFPSQWLQSRPVSPPFAEYPDFSMSPETSSHGSILSVPSLDFSVSSDPSPQPSILSEFSNSSEPSLDFSISSEPLLDLSTSLYPSWDEDHLSSESLSKTTSTAIYQPSYSILEHSKKKSCPEVNCGKAFADLKAHMLTHQKERPEKCPFTSCDYHTKGFLRKYERNRHVLTHYKGIMVCGFCPGSGSAAETSFSRADVFKRHLTSVHAVEQTPPNSRNKTSGGVIAGKKLQDYAPDATVKCSTCSEMFQNPQDFYEHLDDCVLRIVQNGELGETNNTCLLAKVENDQTVHDILQSRGLPITIVNHSGLEDDIDVDYCYSPHRSERNSTDISYHSGGQKQTELTQSKRSERLYTQGVQKKRKEPPTSLAMSSAQINMKKRVMCVFDGPSRLFKDSMWHSTENEVRLPLADGKHYVTDLDVQTLKRAKALFDGTREQLIVELRDEKYVKANPQDDNENVDAATVNVESHERHISQEQSSELVRSPQPLSASGSPIATSNILGKASPYSLRSQDGDSDSCYENETEISDEDYSGISSSSSSSSLSDFDLGGSRRRLLAQVLGHFWDVYNNDFSSIVSECVTVMASGENSGNNSELSGKSRSDSSTSNSLSSLNSSILAKRKANEDELPMDGNGQGPPQSNGVIEHVPKDVISYACPFRKHNPRKYNVHQHQSCALGSFTSIARVKEHLYRRHMAPIQCVRCWLFFKDEDKLTIHLSADIICERRDGQPAEGITSSVERKLRSRKKKCREETDEDRWRAVYRILFPEEDIPSPFYEIVQDDIAQSYELPDISIEDFMRQAVPDIFTSRLQSEINSMDAEDSGLQDELAQLQPRFISRMASLISEAQDAAVQTYRQWYPIGNSQSNQLMTPAPSSSPGSSGMSGQEPTRTHIQIDSQTSNLAIPSWSQDFRSATETGLPSDDDAAQCSGKTQIGQPSDCLLGKLELKSNCPGSSNNHAKVQTSRVGVSDGEHNTSNELFPGMQIPPPYLPSENDTPVDWGAEFDWNSWAMPEPE